MYNKTEWESELGTGLNRFHDAITGNTLELTRQPTSVTRAGTIVTVDRLNNIEDGIELLEEKTLLEETITSSSLTGLGQTSRLWYGMTTLGDDVYACVSNGDIYKQSNGTGNFIALGQTSRFWRNMTTLGNDIYACVANGDIYKQSNGTGDFLPLGQATLEWWGITTLGSDVYASSFNGDIYKQSNGTGDFIALGQTSRQWVGMTSLGNDVYACVVSGDIYKQTNGTGDFIALNQTSRSWYGMTTLGDDIYACVANGDIYKQTNATGDFIALSQTSRQWLAMTALGNNIYASVSNGDIYKVDSTKLGLILDTPLRTYNLSSTSPITIFPTADLGEPKTFRKISSDTNVIIITLPTGHAFSGGGQSITLTNQYEEVTIERVSATEWVYFYPKIVRAEYRKETTQSFATLAIVDFEVKVEDTHNAVTTGANWKFTAPMDGVYQISCFMLGASTLYPTGIQGTGGVVRNGATGICNFLHTGASYSNFLECGRQQVTARLLKNDTIHTNLQLYGTVKNNHPGSIWNQMMIERIGD